LGETRLAKQSASAQLPLPRSANVAAPRVFSSVEPYAPENGIVRQYRDALREFLDRPSHQNAVWLERSVIQSMVKAGLYRHVIVAAVAAGRPELEQRTGVRIEVPVAEVVDQVRSTTMRVLSKVQPSDPLREHGRDGR
jgi:hypothetical protein